jgi:hypothetical protein
MDITKSDFLYIKNSKKLIMVLKNLNHQLGIFIFSTNIKFRLKKINA